MGYPVQFSVDYPGRPLSRPRTAIPHYVVLYFLDIAAYVVVIVAWFAILVTGTYPRGMFHFVEGVIRWNLSVRRAFGTAYEKDGKLIIPVAMVAGGGGGGTIRTRRGNPAVGPDSPPEAGVTAHDSTPQDSGSTDAGGGFGGLVLPSGAYVVKGDQVRWVPAVDVTILATASLSLVRVLARAWTRRQRHRGRP